MQGPLDNQLTTGSLISVPPLPTLDRPVAKLPEFPSFTAEDAPAGVSFELLQQICDDYRLHCQVLLDCVQYLKFAEVRGTERALVERR